MPFTTSQIAPVLQMVERAAGWTGGTPAWARDYYLRCDLVKVQAGPLPGLAQFVLLPFNPAGSMAFEDLLKGYTIDDRVRVTVYPPADPGMDNGKPAARNGTVLFDGQILRHQFNVQDQQLQDGGEGGCAETVSFIGLPIAVLDDRQSSHIIRGRWMADPLKTGSVSGADLYVLESPLVPAAFNAGYRPNCHAQATVACTLTAGGESVQCPVFTHDDDYAGSYWTIRQALLSILGYWLTGPDAAPRNRYVDVDAATVGALTSTSTPTDPLYLGLDARMPQINVGGRGCLSALDMICRQVGFLLLIQPSPRQADGSAPALPYTLSIQRRHAGRPMALMLAKPFTAYTTAEAALKANDTNKFFGMRDGAEICNEVTVVGPQILEVRLDLKPLWDPADMDPSPISMDMQVDDPQLLIQDTGYWPKHIEGGKLFWKYGHVGRAWGIDCSGGFKGYSSGFYQQPAEGFDWVSYLNLQAVTGDYRAAMGIPAADVPVVWSKRLRALMPLRSPVAQYYGFEFWLEVSEDSGSTWQRVPVGAGTLRRQCGILLSVANLAAANISSILSKIPCDVTASWWALLAEQKLRVRLTCTVEADHAERYDALRQATSGTAQKLGQWRVIPAQSVWVQPGTVFNPVTDGTWLHVPPMATVAASAGLYQMRDVALRLRAAMEDCQVIAGAATPLMDISHWKLGDAVQRVGGREYSLGANMGAQTAYPNVVGITYRIGLAQSIELELDSQRLLGGQK